MRIAPSAPPAIALTPNAPSTISTRAPGIAFALKIRMTSAVNTYAIAMNGTTTCATLEILCKPPISTSATKIVRMMPEITTLHEYSLPNNCTICVLSASKNPFTALVIPLICVNVPIPNRPTHIPITANTFASHFHFLPIPFSM